MVIKLSSSILFFIALQLVSPWGSTRLHLVQPLDKLNELGPALILQLVLVAENSLEDGNELRSELTDSGVLPLVKLADHVVQGVVLLVVVLERKDSEKDGKDILNGNVLAVAEDHAAQATGSIVLKTGDIHVKALLQTRENGGELLDNLVLGLGVLNETANGVGSVGASLSILITKAVDKELQEASGVRGDSGTHTVDALSNDTDSGGALKSLGAASIAHDSLFEDLPQLGKAGAKSSSHTRDNIETGVNDNPVELRSLLTGFEGLLFRAELELARVLLGNDVSDHGDHVVQGGLVGDQGRTAVTQVLSHVAVDVGDGSTSYLQVSFCNQKAIIQQDKCVNEYQKVVSKRVSHHARLLRVGVSWVNVVFII